MANKHLVLALHDQLPGAFRILASFGMLEFAYVKERRQPTVQPSAHMREAWFSSGRQHRVVFGTSFLIVSYNAQPMGQH